MTRTFAALAALAAAGPAAASDSFTWGERNTAFEPAFPAQFRAELAPSDVSLSTQVLAGGLVHPWGIAVLPDGYLVTERSGQMRHLSPDGALSAPIGGVPAVVAQEQGGLLDVAVGPDFARDRTVFFTYAKPTGDGLSAAAAARAVLSEDNAQLTQVTDIFVQEPPAPEPMHYGARIVLLGDGTAAITTGERFTDANRELAQDLGSTYGKVVRVNLDGSTPQDNPFVGRDGALDTIWSYGHRNIQGAVVAEDGTLWTIEHGPQGGDELNRPEPGLNYGWPVISYGARYDFNGGGAVGSGQAQAEGMEQPVYFWDPVIAPGGMQIHRGEAFSEWNGDMLIGSLYPGGVVRLSLEEGRVVEEERLLRDIGRVRDVEVLDDGTFLILTDFENGSVIHVRPEGSS
jgi:glucose/arabinose dehydrogenase